MNHPKTPTRLSLLTILSALFFFISLLTLIEHSSRPLHAAMSGSESEHDTRPESGPSDQGTIPKDEITLTKTASQSYVKPGAHVTYTVRIRNAATVSVTLHLTDTLPAALLMTGTPTTTQGTLKNSAAVITWTATISPQQVISISYSALVTNVTEGATITNQVTLDVKDNFELTATAALLVKTHWELFLPVIEKTLPPPLPVMLNGNFEAGSHTVGWIETSEKFNNSLIVTAPILPSPIVPHSLNAVAWLGGQDKEKADLAQTIAIPAGYPTLKLHYFYWIASLDNQCGGASDLGYLRVNNSERAIFELCKAKNTNSWHEGFISVGEYANQTVTFHFAITLDDAQNSNLFLDDVSFCTNCGS